MSGVLLRPCLFDCSFSLALVVVGVAVELALVVGQQPKVVVPFCFFVEVVLVVAGPLLEEGRSPSLPWWMHRLQWPLANPKLLQCSKHSIVKKHRRVLRPGGPQRLMTCRTNLASC